MMNESLQQNLRQNFTYGVPGLEDKWRVYYGKSRYFYPDKGTQPEPFWFENYPTLVRASSTRHRSKLGTGTRF